MTTNFLDTPLDPMVPRGRPTRNHYLESGANPFAEQFAGLDIAGWEDRLAQSIESRFVDGIAFPTFPDDEVQMGMHGTVSRQSVAGAMKFYRFITEHATASGVPIAGSCRLLDFGTGWGRMLRPFMRDLRLENLYGVEPNPWFCMLARGHNPYVSIVKSEYEPPLPFGQGVFNAVTSWSVFSHLGERMARSWLYEFHRVCAPGARLYLTTWGKRFFEVLSDARARRASGQTIHFYHAIVLDALGEDVDSAIRSYDKGEFVFLASQGTQTYGEAWISPACMEGLLPLGMRVVAHDCAALSQDVFVIERI
jgi:ubiquinone/menaquinone biosynthesis C-methylase UbiE